MPLLPTTLTPAEPNLNNARLEVLFIDPGVAGWESLVQGVRPGVEVVLLDADQDGLSQMALWAGSRQDVAAVHVLSHGATAQLNLGNLKLTTQALNNRSADLATLGAALTAEGDVLLYGCNVASGDAGSQFVALMADLTGADISASEDATGSALFGGDWLLEAQVGSLESVSPFNALALNAYSGLLGVGNLNFDAWPYTSSTNASSVNLDGWIFSGGNSYALGTFDELGLAYLSAPSDSSDRVLVLNANSNPGVSSFTVKSADGSNFDLNSFSLASFGATSLNLVAYRDGQWMYSQSLDLTNAGSGSQFSYALGRNDGVNVGASGSLTLGPAFDNVDEIQLNFQGDASVELDDIVATPVPSIHSAIYNVSTGQLTVSGTDFVAAAGASNDIIANRFTLTGEGWTTYTLFDTANVEIDNANSFTLTLSATDKAAINQILNKDGTSSTGSTTYNLAAAEGWAMGFNAGTSTADNTGNGIIVSNVVRPSFTSATYDALTGILNVTGNGFSKSAGASNDIDASKFTFTGEGGETYTLTSTSSVEIISGTNFVLSLSANDRASVNTILNKNGTSSTSGSTYNLAAAQNWAAGASSVPNSDLTGNGITLSNVAAPSIISGSYDGSTGILVVTGTGFVKRAGASNDIDTSKFTVTGESGVTYTLTDTSPAEITSGTSFALTLSPTDKAAVNQILNSDGTSSRGGTTYNLLAAEDWATGADAPVNVADFSGNGITVSNAPPPPTTMVVTAQLSNDTGSSPSDFITSGAVQTVSGTLSANLLAGESVWVSFDNGASWGTALFASGNLWSTSTTLVGSNTMKVRVESSAGAGASYAQAYTLDTTQPSAPSAPDLASGSDTGISNSDDLTYDTTPTLTGTAENGSTVEVYDTDGITILGSTTANGGNWSITTSSLAVGQHTFWAKATDPAGNVSSASSGLMILIKNSAPTVLFVAVPANGLYGAGTTLDFTVNFSETVTVDTSGGTPVLTLNLDTGGPVTASYVSGSGSSALVFRYTIANGHMDTNGVTLGVIHANGGSVMDNAGNLADLTLNNVASTSQIEVDGVAPAVMGVSVPAHAFYKAADNLDFTVHFNEDITVDTGNGTPAIALVVGTNLVYATYISGSGSNSLVFRHTIIAGMNDSNGITISSLSLLGGTLRDAAGNHATLTLNNVGSTAGVRVDTTAPTVTHVSVPVNATYKVGDNLDFTVNFDEVVMVTTSGGVPEIALTLGAATVYATYIAGSGSSALTFRYTVSSGDVDVDGLAVGAVSLNGGTIQDAANNLAITTLNNVGSTAAVLVDGAAPTVTGVSSAHTHAANKAGDVITIQVTFSENVTVTGTPQLTLETGTIDRAVDYASGSGSNTLVFNYTVQAGDTSSDLDYTSTTALALNGGTITDSAGNDALLTLASPGAVNSLGHNNSFVIDTTAPAVSSVSVPANGTYRPGNPLNFTVNFSENVTVTGSPVLTLSLDTGGTVEAAYTSGGGTSALTFRYTVSAGNIDTDGISVGALDLKGGVLRDAAGQDAALTLNNVASTAAVRVDNAIAAPVFDSNLTNVVSVYQGKGYTMETIISSRPGGGTNTTQTIAPVAVPVADIPLGGSVQEPTLLAQLPEGVGLQSFGSTNLSQGMTNPEQWVMQDLQQFIMGQPLLRPTETLQPQAADFLQGLPQGDEMSFRVISLVAAGSNPSPIVVDIRPPDAVLSAGHAVGLVIDTQALAFTPTTVLLNNIDFAAIVGPAIIVGGSGSNWVVGDSASQLIFLGVDDDVLHGGGGDDTVASTTGRDRLFGAAGHDLVVGGRDSDVLDGGDGHDVIQGGDSDAGTWSFSIVKGELISQFVHANALLTPQDSLRHVGPWWSDASQTQHLDDRLAFSLETPERLQLVSTLYDIVTGGLPDLNALNFYSTSSKSDSQLAQLAADELLAAVKGLPLEAQARSVIEKAWGAGQASEALLPEALAYLANGGSWADGLLALVRSPVAAARFSDGLGFALSQDLVSSELGWSKNSGHDFLHGGAGQDRLVGGDGNDVIYGGPGTDLAAWMGQLNDYTIQLSHLATDKGVLLRHVATGEEDFLADVELIQIGARYFRLPDASTSDLSLSQAVALGEFAQEVSWQEVQLVGSHLLGHVV